jgi:hypothetical protein
MRLAQKWQAQGSGPPETARAGTSKVVQNWHLASALAREDQTVDADLENLDRDALIREVKRLRAGIREHRDSTGHELCWHHPKLWGLLPEKTDPQPIVPAWPQFLRGCLKYRESLDRQLPAARRIDDEA